MVRPSLGELGWGTWAVARLAIPVAKVPFGSRNLVRIARIPRCSVSLLRQVDHLLDVSQSLRVRRLGSAGIGRSGSAQDLVLHRAAGESPVGTEQGRHHPGWQGDAEIAKIE